MTLEAVSPECNTIGPQRAMLVLYFIPHKDWKTPLLSAFSEVPTAIKYTNEKGRLTEAGRPGSFLSLLQWL